MDQPENNSLQNYSLIRVDESIQHWAIATDQGRETASPHSGSLIQQQHQESIHQMGYSEDGLSM